MQHIGWGRVVRALALVSATLLVSRAAEAQTGKISGLVTDAATGNPIEGAQVVVQGTGYGAVSNANGRYFIISVPPGTYTLQARRIGLQTTQVPRVTVAIDVTREVNFRMNTAAATIAAVRIEASQETPLVEQGIVGSQTTIDSEVIQSLPVTNIAGVLALQQGFTAVPENTQLISLAEEQRSTVVPIRVRGGRGGATVTLIDGIPINNPLFGTEAIQLNALSVQAVDFVRGYMEPQYGNGLSGVINQALREGGTQVAGSVDYRTSAVAGAMGSTSDELRDYHILRGFLSGPVPSTRDKLRYAVSGQLESGAARVLEFDQNVYSFDRNQVFPGRPPWEVDMIPGWQAFGGRQNNQLLGKLTLLPTSSSRINLSVIDQQRQSLGYERRNYALLVGDPIPRATTLADTLGLVAGGFRNLRDIALTSVRDKSRLYMASAQQNFGRTSLQVRVAQTELDRNTCNIYLGVCFPQPFVRANFREQFVFPFPVEGVPYRGSGLVYGGEKYKTNTIRGDLQSQVTDHHNLQIGASFVRHDIEYQEIRGPGGNSGMVALDQVIPQLYRAKPIEAATYFQDRIEYDFLTVRLGVRFDYGRAEGRGLANPLDPSNGTTAREVCEGTARSLGASTPFSREATIRRPDGTDTTISLSGAPACLFQDVPGQRPAMLDSAVGIAQRDDFIEAKARTAFSPRIGVSFPLTPRSQVFFNAGRYTMNPLYSYLYRNSGVGTIAGPGDNFCGVTKVKPGTRECVPPLRQDNPDFVGNPNLRLEEATQYEVGYGAEFGRGYAVNVAVYNRDESGLSGLQSSRPTQDIGSTYDAAFPDYTTVTNRDFLTARGMEIQFRRRTQNRWGYDLNYGWSRASTNSPPPERSQEILQGGEIDRTLLRETVADIDQTHRFNARLTFDAGVEPPNLPYGMGRVLAQTSATVTYTFSSGFPYTPITGFSLGNVTNSSNARDVNSARAPSTQVMNLIVQKGFDIQGARYGLFLQVDNVFDRRNCVQVFVNTGTCQSGLRDPINRRVGNFNEETSTSLDQPEYIGARRQVNTGLSVRF